MKTIKDKYDKQIARLAEKSSLIMDDWYGAAGLFAFAEIGNSDYDEKIM